VEIQLGDDFGYCEGCGKRITGEDFGYGDAVRKENRIYCIDCFKQSSAETGMLPARGEAEPKRKSPSTRSMPAQGSRRRLGRKKRRHSTRKAAAGRGHAGSGAALSTPPRKAQVQKVVASVICPHCSEKLVVKVVAFPSNHTCELCRKVMRLEAPKG
jgi:hypothetical protein